MKTPSRYIILIISLVIGAIGMGVGAYGIATKNNAPEFTAQPAPTVVAVKAKPWPSTFRHYHYGSGWLEVPAMIEPGTYQISGIDGKPMPCRWDTYDHAKAKVGDVATGGAWVKRGEGAFMTINETDKMVLFTNCGFETP